MGGGALIHALRVVQATMQRSYFLSPIGAAAALYSSVFCGQQNGGHVNRGVCLPVVERKGEWAGRGGDFGVSGVESERRGCGV